MTNNCNFNVGLPLKIASFSDEVNHSLEKKFPQERECTDEKIEKTSGRVLSTKEQSQLSNSKSKKRKREILKKESLSLQNQLTHSKKIKKEDRLSLEPLPSEVWRQILGHLTIGQREAVNRVSRLWRFLATSLVSQEDKFEGQAFYRTDEFQEILRIVHLHRENEELFPLREVKQVKLTGKDKQTGQGKEFFLQIVNYSQHHFFPDPSQADIQSDEWRISLINTENKLTINSEKVGWHTDRELSVSPDNAQWIVFPDSKELSLLHLYIKDIGDQAINKIWIKRVSTATKTSWKSELCENISDPFVSQAFPRKLQYKFDKLNDL